MIIFETLSGTKLFVEQKYEKTISKNKNDISILDPIQEAVISSYEIKDQIERNYATL